MATHWIFSSTYLPHSGEPVDFQIDDREEPLHGTFANGCFHSRWADYAVERVRSWRKAMVDPLHEPIATPGLRALRSWWMPLPMWALVQRAHGGRAALTPALSADAPVAVQHDRVDSAMAGTTKPRYHSNQISS